LSEEGGRRERASRSKRRQSREDVDAESEEDAMTLLKRHVGRRRHIGRRVAAVGAGVALLVLGLQAPAFAAAPTVTSFTPTSGPEGCVIVITGTAFTDFPDTDPQYNVDFVLGGTSPDATTFAVISATEIWATVPDLLAGSAYTVRVTNDGGSGSSTATFLATADGVAGACGPTITSFTPTCGSASDAVVITGTNLLEPDLTGGDVRFAPYPATEAGTVQPDVDGPTSLSVVVPSGTGDGAIRVNTFSGAGGQAFSTAPFLVPPPDCIEEPTVEGHPRAITLTLKKHLRARGVVSSTEDPAFTDCVASVPVNVQRKKKGGGWKNVGTTTTTDTGSYKVKIKDKPGKYRAIAPKVAGTTAADDCLKAKSARRTHKH
jgi:hypothetical protein